MRLIDWNLGLTNLGLNSFDSHRILHQLAQMIFDGFEGLGDEFDQRGCVASVSDLLVEAFHPNFEDVDLSDGVSEFFLAGQRVESLVIVVPLGAELGDLMGQRAVLARILVVKRGSLTSLTRRWSRKPVQVSVIIQIDLISKIILDFDDVVDGLVSCSIDLILELSTMVVCRFF